MGLREDIETMERHSRNGTLREYLLGTAKPLPRDDDYPTDRSARPGLSTYAWITLRGD